MEEVIVTYRDEALTMSLIDEIASPSIAVQGN